MKYRIQLSGGGLSPSIKYRKTEESAQSVFDSAFDVPFLDMTHNRAVLMCNDGKGWLMMEEKAEKDGNIEWIEYDFNFELSFDDGQFLEVSQASMSVDSARSDIYSQYQNDDLSSVEYVGWTS